MTQTRPALRAANAQSPENALESYARAFPETDVDALETHLVLASASGALTRGIEGAIQEAGFDLTRPRYTIVRMLFLSDEQSLPQSEIAQQMGVSGANVTQLIDALASDGWVERVASPNDRRVTLATLTEPGKKRCAILVPAIVDFMVDSCSVLDGEERAQLRELLHKVRARLIPPD